MGALLDEFTAAGVQIEPAPGGNVRVRGPLNEQLRAAIRANKPAILAELAANDSTGDQDTLRRRAKALAMLDANPGREIAVIAERGNPAHIAIAIRGVAVGEMEIPAERYDGFALLALMQQHGHA